MGAGLGDKVEDTVTWDPYNWGARVAIARHRSFPMSSQYGPIALSALSPGVFRHMDFDNLTFCSIGAGVDTGLQSPMLKSSRIDCTVEISIMHTVRRRLNLCIIKDVQYRIQHVLQQEIESLVMTTNQRRYHVFDLSTFQLPSARNLARSSLICPRLGAPRRYHH